MKTIYQSSVISVGTEAEETFSAGYIITFGEGAPAALADYCFVLKPEINEGAIASGMMLGINERHYPITAVGDIAAKNLHQLSHITLRFDGAPSAVADGAVHVDGTIPDEIHLGDQITVYSH